MSEAVRKAVPSPGGEGQGEGGRSLSAIAAKFLATVWRLRRGRPHAIDVAIARRADTEMFYDQRLVASCRFKTKLPEL